MPYCIFSAKLSLGLPSCPILGLQTGGKKHDDKKNDDFSTDRPLRCSMGGWKFGWFPELQWLKGVVCTARARHYPLPVDGWRHQSFQPLFGRDPKKVYWPFSAVLVTNCSIIRVICPLKTGLLKGSIQELPNKACLIVGAPFWRFLKCFLAVYLLKAVGLHFQVFSKYSFLMTYS